MSETTKQLPDENTAPVPDITIVMSCYNEAHWLPLTIDATLAQSFQNFEFRVINDASTDNSAEILGGYADPRLIIANHTVRNGWLNNINLMGNAARGSLIKFMCPDDLIKPDCLEKAWQFYRAHPEVGYIFSGYSFIDEFGNPYNAHYVPSFPEIMTGATADRFAFKNGSLGNTSGLFVPQDRWREMGGMRDLCRNNPKKLPNVEDLDLMIRLQEKYPVGYLQDALVKIREHRQQLHRNSEGKALGIEAYILLLTELAKRNFHSRQMSAVEIKSRFAVYVSDFFNTAIVMLLKREWGHARLVFGSIFKAVPAHRALYQWGKYRLVPYIKRNIQRSYHKMHIGVKRAIPTNFR